MQNEATEQTERGLYATVKWFTDFIKNPNATQVENHLIVTGFETSKMIERQREIREFFLSNWVSSVIT